MLSGEDPFSEEMVQSIGSGQLPARTAKRIAKSVLQSVGKEAPGSDINALAEGSLSNGRGVFNMLNFDSRLDRYWLKLPLDCGEDRAT